ncbi:MAG: hypothetical protein IJL45_06335 [Prevotella sp.]|nr:hypothetical protein [Prevotella sp.]
MKRLSIYLALSLIWLSGAWAQEPDFDLYFANNVTDVANFDEIKNPDSGLRWTKVQTATGDMSGNYVEVDNIVEMLGSTRKKWLADQQQFWTMRDHSLLCFRIDGHGDTSSAYEVTLDNGDGEKITQTVRDYFFANLPLQEEPYEIKVYRVGEPEKYYRFRYFIKDWNNDNLYIFQLDQKRQVENKPYSLECVVGSMNEEGDIERDTTRLELQAKSFQSIYIPEGKDLLDVIFVNEDNKLRIDKKKLHPGIDLNDRFKYMELSENFYLDKHENREFMNFNWLGSGLFEKYDTLYLSLWNERCRRLTSGQFHVESVNEHGQPTGNTAVRYFGYDKDKGAHKIITMGEPAYIEVIVNGYLPVVYKYSGPADPETGIVSEERCAVDLTLTPGRVNSKGLTFSSQHFLNLTDEKTIIVRGGKDHVLCSVDEIDLSAWLPVDTIHYAEDCGQNYPKLLDNKPIDRFAKLRVAFSRPKGDATVDCNLTVIDLETHAKHDAPNKELQVLSANVYKSFTYDYVYADFDLLDVVPHNSVCQFSLSSGDFSYAQFPYIHNFVFDRDKSREDTEEEIDNKYVTDKEDDVNDVSGSSGFDCKIAPEFKFSFNPVTVKTSFGYDIRKSLWDLKVNIIYNGGERELPDKDKLAREELQAAENYEYSKVPGTEKVSVDVVGNDKKLDGWIYEDIDDIFDMSSKKIGQGWFGGAFFNFKMPTTDFSRFQVAKASGQIGYGIGLYWGNVARDAKFQKLANVLEKVKKYVSFTAFAQASLQMDFGVKSYIDGVSDQMSGTNMGYFAHFSGKVAAGASLNFFTPENIGGVKVSSWLNFKAGLRFGAKVGVQFGVEGPFAKYVPGVGFRSILLVVGQAYAQLKTPIFRWSGSGQVHFGFESLKPDDNTNPFHPGFPYWIEKSNAKPMSEAYTPLKAPESDEEIGTVLVADVASDANPHYLDGNNVIYNDLRSAGDYNDDRVALLNTSDNTTETLSTDGFTASNHMRSKRGDHEVVVFEQFAKKVTDDDIDNDHLLVSSNELQKHSVIKAAFREGDGVWQLTDMTTDDGLADLKPVVTIQEDGKAACIYQHGRFIPTDETVPMDSITNVGFEGQLMLRTFNEGKWSSPTPLYFDIDREHAITHYDLLMRNDTVLVAANLIASDMEHSVTRYASKPIASEQVKYVDDNISARYFMMHRVGHNAVIAMLYEKSDSIREIYVKTLNMNGQGDGRQGSDLGVRSKMPGKMKIVCDRNAVNLSDFALLWTEQGSVYREEDGSKHSFSDIRTLLNASRIHLDNTLQLTDPITLGCEVDSLVLTDFDGFLDDSHISVVYTLADIEAASGVIMTNGKDFSNNFEAEVSYAKVALKGSDTLPVNVRIRNTGTSAIQAVSVTINGQRFDIENAYVAPLKESNFVVLYPIDEHFDGYITSTVYVEYNNVFKTKVHPRFKALDNRRGKLYMARTRVLIADVECNVVNRSIVDGENTFVVELIDHGMMLDDMGVKVGVYAHPSIGVPLSDDAEVVVKGSDFVKMGNVRKAYATVTVSGITEPLKAYVNTHVFDTNYENGDLTLSHIDNLHGEENPVYVSLFPEGDPTKIVRPTLDDFKNNHHVKITVLDNGVSLNGLNVGETIRIFNTEGIPVCNKQATSSTQFIPLQRHDVYVLSAGDEVFKFRY